MKEFVFIKKISSEIIVLSEIQIAAILINKPSAFISLYIGLGDL